MYQKPALRAAVFAILFLACACARADDVKSVQVPPGDLVTALESLSRQAGIELIYQAEQLKGLTTAGVTGVLSAQEAVARLLEGSPLTLKIDSSGAMLIAPPEANISRPHGSGRSRSPSEAPLPAGEVTRPSGRQARSEEPRPENREVPAAADGVLEEIVVTGTRLSGTPMSAPITVYDSEWLARAGVATTADFARILPQNVNNIDSTQLGLTSGPNFGRGTAINLRGLGADSTLVLLNGRRLASAGGASGRFVDVSAIPLAAIERVEVLTDGASAIYGADAVAGVVNFIFRDDYTGLGAELRTGGDWRGDSPEYGANLIGGSTTERLWLFGGVEYYSRDPLVRTDRSFSSSDELTRFGGTDRRPDFAQPGNVFSLDGGPLPGLGTPFAALPPGQDGTSLTAADLVPGELNYDDNVYGEISPDQERYSLFGLAEMALTESVALSLDGFYAANETHGSSWPDAIVAPVFTNPFNPLPGPVVVRYSPAREIGAPRDLRETDTYTANVGLEGDVGWLGSPLADWSWSLTATFARDETTTTIVNSIDSNALAAALNDPDPATAFNPFGDGSAQNPDTLAGIISGSRRDGSSELGLYTAIVRGSLFDLPGGAVELALGGEYRDEAFDTVFAATSGTVSEGSTARNATSFFAELRVPLIGRSQSLPLVRELELSAAVRHEDYSDFGDTTSPRFGIGWRIGEMLLVRASYGRSFRPPLLYELTAAPATLVFPLIDPARDNEQVTVELIQGGNPDLRPETSNNLTAGFRIEPAEDFRFDVNYFDIEYDNRILSGLNPFMLLPDEEYLGPKVIVRAEPTPEDLAASRPGRLLAIDARSFNASVTEVQGVDFQAAAHVETGYGDVGLNLSGTHIVGYDNRLTPLAPVMDVVNTIDYPVDWRYRASASWTSGQWFGLVAANYTAGYKNDQVTPVQAVDSWTTIDLQLRYSPRTAGALEGLVMTAGVGNVLDEDPPFVDVRGGFDPRKASAFGRNWFLSLQKEW